MTKKEIRGTYSTTMQVRPGCMASACISNWSCWSVMRVSAPYRQLRDRERARTYHSVLLLIAHYLDISRQLSLLPDGDESSSKPHSQDRTQEETTSIETDNDINFGSGVGGGCNAWDRDGGDVVEKVGDKGLESDRVAQDGLVTSVR